MGEKRIILILLIILLFLFGKMIKGDIFKPVIQSETEQDSEIEEKKIEQETEHEKSVRKENVVEISYKEEYMELYPDMYVKNKAKIPLAVIDENVLDYRKYMFRFPVNDNVQNEKKIAYLTFDDGPSENTAKVLEILKKYNIKATFFMIASSITPEYYDLVNEMIKEGHVVGVHTYSHNYRQIYASVKDYLDDFYLAYTKMYEVTGVQPIVFRFPGGSYNSFLKKIREQVIDEMERRGFIYYDWQVSAEDSIGNPTKATITRNVLKDFKKHKKPIVLMHDSSLNKLTVQSLENIIQTMKEEGYTFDTVDKR
ncbi:polysaccharide deacetylase family protein [Anaerosporobacter sp.]|uniref:polysaccharide deacetylase family protein n=1 Tax=Anaerosporobacter sp. TaxID=1872529 RepID=UPI00286F37A5|nr:polysaccharide deacetylase family protein [Anaerosporobacter sp.]